MYNDLVFYKNEYAFADKYYVVDAGYPNRIAYRASYKGEGYHKEKFSRIHARVRSIIERSFGVWKMSGKFYKQCMSICCESKR